MSGGESARELAHGQICAANHLGWCCFYISDNSTPVHGEACDMLTAAIEARDASHAAQLKACHELIDGRDKTIRNMEASERAKLEMASKLFQAKAAELAESAAREATLREALERALLHLDRCSTCNGQKTRLIYADGDRERWERCRSCEGSGRTREGDKAAAFIDRGYASVMAL